MNKPDPNWQFVVPRTSAEFKSWSYGKVDNKSDLYDPTIFGPADDLKCNCGKFSGQEVVDIICDKCGVRVYADAALARKQRLGHMELAMSCPHPLDEDVLIEAIPIAPVGYRTGTHGSPNSLGRKYEALLETSASLAQRLPSKGSTEYYTASKKMDLTELRTAMSDITGITKGDVEKCNIHTNDSLLGLLVRSIVELDPSICSIVRSCGCVLKLDIMA